jgi:hypothetical protein
MKNTVHWIFVVYAFLAVFSMIGIAISISYQNVPLILIFIVLVCTFMGVGFRTKKKYREAGKLE